MQSTLFMKMSKLMLIKMKYNEVWGFFEVLEFYKDIWDLKYDEK